MFRKMPFILAAVILAVIFLNPLLPLGIKQFLYAISLSIKSVIRILLPFIIFGLLFKAAVMLSNKATKIIGLILAFVCLSSFISIFISYYIGEWVYNFNLSMILPKETSDLVALWSFNLPKLIANDRAMFAGIILGILAAKFYPKQAAKIADKLDKVIEKALHLIVYLIPLFVAGFVIKLQYDGVMTTIIKEYGSIFLIIALSQITYLTLAYFLLSNLKLKEFIANIKNMIPAAISGFSTMSSAASMPLTIIGAQSNAKNKDLAKSIIPATVNIHLVGDCFATPILAFAILKSFCMADPSMLSYLIFTFYFILAKFSVAAIPGGGIIVMLPILENYLGFNSDMMSLITALYILFDPVITCANVLGNGAFAKMIDRVVSFINKS